MAAPTISVIQPATASAGSVVTILGSGFIGATAVKFGNTDAVFTVTNNSQIRATVPAGSGSVLVTVVTPEGTSNGRAFCYTGTPGAAVQSITPASLHAEQ